MAQNKQTLSTAQNFIGGGDFSKTLPSPDKASFVQWEGGAAQNSLSWRQIFDVITTGDSGVTGTFLSADATHGARNMYDSVSRQERSFRGAQFAYTARNTTFKCRLGFAFEDPGTCQSENHFGISNDANVGGGLNFVGFHILDAYNGPAHENYHAIVVVNDIVIFDKTTPIPVEVLAYVSDPIAHNFQVRMQQGGQNILWLIDGIAVASYGVADGAPQTYAAAMFFRQASLNGTTGHMVSQVEFMYMDNTTI